MTRQRRNAGRGRHVVVLLLLAICLSLAAISCVLALRLYRRSDPVLAGSWRMRCDLTETARARANAWLSMAELGERVDAGDDMPRLSADVVLRLDADGRWSRSVDEAGLEKARKDANRAFAAALRRLIQLRISDAGRAPETAEQVERRLVQTLGLSGEDYLAACGPALLPGAEELRARYEGSGAWQAEGQRIRFDGRSVRYLADNGLLVLSDGTETEVYERVGY